MKRVAVIGSGPSGLMLADVLSRGGCHVTLYERRQGLGRKLFIAGSSGLNISHHLAHDDFVKQYTPANFFEKPLRAFGVESWLSFVQGLGLKTFLGTSNRYFIEMMHALPLVRAWKRRLIDAGVVCLTDYDCTAFASLDEQAAVALTFANQERAVFDAVAFCLGGASYEEHAPVWPEMFKANGIEVRGFEASNVGYQVQWPEAFLKEADGKPLKDIVLSTGRGSKRGDIIVTAYGLEGTPVYTVGCAGGAFLDLKPSLSEEEVFAKLSDSAENLSPMRRAKKRLKLSDASLALLFHLSPRPMPTDLRSFARLVKRCPIWLTGPQPMTEAISTTGGLALGELNDDFMLTKVPGVFAAGEMLDWDAPTGGFLIQGCVSQAYVAAHGILKFLSPSLV